MMNQLGSKSTFLLAFFFLVVISAAKGFVVPLSSSSSSSSPLSTTTKTTKACHPSILSSWSSSSSAPLSRDRTVLSMGFFDYFSPEAKEGRERKKRLDIEEQERLQRAIIERRKNPELMREYERKVAIRRELRMQGRFEEAAQVAMYEGFDGHSLLDGSKGMELATTVAARAGQPNQD